MLDYFPRDYRTETEELPIAELKPDDLALARGQVVAVNYTPMHPRPRFEATLDDGSGKLSLVWFNGGFLRKRVVPGITLRVQGKVKYFRSMPSMSNPKWSEVDVHRIAGKLIELDDRTFAELEHVFDEHARSAQLDLDVQLDVAQQVDARDVRLLQHLVEVRELERVGVDRRAAAANTVGVRRRDRRIFEGGLAKQFLDRRVIAKVQAGFGRSCSCRGGSGGFDGSRNALRIGERRRLPKQVVDCGRVHGGRAVGKG